jgi:hypothetical protein
MLLSKGYQLTLKLYNVFVFNVMAIRLFLKGRLRTSIS